MLETYECFAHFEDQYILIGPGSYWYGKWFVVNPPARGYKIHVTTTYGNAENVAQTALSVLRTMRIPHKVVRNGERLREQLATQQAGKFITIYTTGPQQRDQVVRELDPKMGRIGLPLGPVPTTPDAAGRRTAEERLGGSGYLYGRLYDERTADD
jgi:hypothetical protein